MFMGRGLLKFYRNALSNPKPISISGWGILNGAATATVNANEINFTAAAANVICFQTITLPQTVIARKYYCQGKIKSTSNLVALAFGNVVTTKYHSGSGNYETISLIATATAVSQSINIRDTRSSGWDLVKGKEFMVVDLTTTFGVGKEPTLDWCDANLTWIL